MAWRSNKKGLAVVGLFLFLMGVAVPAAFGLLTEKAMGLGVGDLLDKSTNWDESNIANSTYFTDIYARFFDNETKTIYLTDVVVDSDLDMQVSMADKSSTYGSGEENSDWFAMYYMLNVSAFNENVDKVVILASIQDAAALDVDNARVILRIKYEDADATWHTLQAEYYNATALVNSTVRHEITIDAIKRLKLQNAQAIRVDVTLAAKDGAYINSADNVILASKVELYDVKKVNATAASNIMLAVSGILGWLGALAATPYWNPYSNREHRNVRRVGRAVKRRIPRRRR